jgi:hypothetical protein
MIRVDLLLTGHHDPMIRVDLLLTGHHDHMIKVDLDDLLIIDQP